MKIMSNKKYEKMAQQLVDLQLDLNDAKDENDILERQVQLLVEQNKTKDEKINKMEDTCDNQKKEIKRLKFLCTKNGVKYKKEKE